MGYWIRLTTYGIAITLASLRPALAQKGALDPVTAADPRRRMAAEALTLLRVSQDQVPPLQIAHALALLSEHSADGLALQQAREAWSLIRTSAEGDTWHTANVKVHIARCFLQQGLLTEAEALLLPAHELLKAHMGESNGHTLEARSQLFALYTAWGKPRQAAAFAPTVSG